MLHTNVHADMIFTTSSPNGFFFVVTCSLFVKRYLEFVVFCVAMNECLNSFVHFCFKFAN